MIIMKFQTQIEKLGIKNEVENIIINCECGEITGARLVDLNKLRKWEVIEEIGNYFNEQERHEHIEETDWTDIKRISTFCKAFNIKEEDISTYYAEAICEWGYEIAYPITDNIVLVLE